MGIAILDGDKEFIVAVVPIYHEDTGKKSLSEQAFRDRCRPGILKEEDTECECAEEPGIAVLSVVSPTGFTGSCR